MLLLWEGVTPLKEFDSGTRQREDCKSEAVVWNAVLVRTRILFQL